MANKFRPFDIGIWFENVDVNALSDDECAQISNVDIENDQDLKWLIRDWIRPRYLLWDERNRNEMRDILEYSKNWSDDEVRSAVEEFHLPSGQKINDVGRFLEALRGEFLK
jgi:hypothetical protein